MTARSYRIKRYSLAGRGSETANADKNNGILTQREIDDALEIWVNDINGESKDEIADDSAASFRDEWFVEA